MRDPSYATGGKGSEVTLVYDGGAGNQGIKYSWWRKGESHLSKLKWTTQHPILTDYSQLNAVADFSGSSSCGSAVVWPFWRCSYFDREWCNLATLKISIAANSHTSILYQLIDDWWGDVRCNTAENHPRATEGQVRTSQHRPKRAWST